MTDGTTSTGNGTEMASTGHLQAHPADYSGVARTSTTLLHRLLRASRHPTVTRPICFVLLVKPHHRCSPQPGPPRPMPRWPGGVIHTEPVNDVWRNCATVRLCGGDCVGAAHRRRRLRGAAPPELPRLPAQHSGGPAVRARSSRGRPHGATACPPPSPRPAYDAACRCAVKMR